MPDPQPNYLILTGLNADELQSKVNSHIQNGFQPLGGIATWAVDVVEQTSLNNAIPVHYMALAQAVYKGSPPDSMREIVISSSLIAEVRKIRRENEDRTVQIWHFGNLFRERFGFTPDYQELIAFLKKWTNWPAKEKPGRLM